MNPIELEKLRKMDEHLVVVNIAERKRLGWLGVVSFGGTDEQEQSHVMFYDFVSDPAEPLLPIGVVTSASDVERDFGPLREFFSSHSDVDTWAEQINIRQPVTHLTLARFYLCSTGKIRLPDSDSLVARTASQQQQGKPLGFGLGPELVEDWIRWAIQEDEISRNFSRARRLLSQAISDAATAS